VSTRQESMAKIDKTSATRRAADAAHDVIDETASKAEVLEQRVRESAQKANEKVESSQEAASEQINRSLAKAETFAKESPVAAAGIAFAAGLFVSSILRR